MKNKFLHKSGVALFLLCLLSIHGLYAQVDSLSSSDSSKVEEDELGSAVVSIKKDPIQKKADRTIIDFSQQSNLNSGTLNDGLKKIPGLIVSDMVGVVYQGKALEVYLDGRPLNIYSDELNSYLEGMPANAVDRIEIITHPGAEFAATSGGAILNIITSRYYKRYLSAIYSGGYRVSNYDKLRHRYNNNVMIQSGNKILSWQLRIGQSSTQYLNNSNYFTKNFLLNGTTSDSRSNYYFAESGIKFYLKKDKILLNYNVSSNPIKTDLSNITIGSLENYINEQQNLRNEVAIEYQKRFNKTERQLNFKLNYTNTPKQYQLKNQPSNIFQINNGSNRNFYQFRTDYKDQIDFLDETLIRMGILAEEVQFNSESFEVENFKYKQRTLASYLETQFTKNKIDLITGLRLESYDIQGQAPPVDLIPFQQTRLFPNITFQYTFLPKIVFNAAYNQKITLPNTSDLNPNNTNYQGQNVDNVGNPYLMPTLYHNYSVEFSAYEYLTLSYSISEAKNQVAFRVTEDSTGLRRSYTNIENCRIQNFSFGFPFPFMLFTKGLKKTLEFDFNPDEINFLYAYVGYNKQDIPERENKGFWTAYFMTQFILPADINFTTTYRISDRGGNFYYVDIKDPLQNSLGVNFSKKFLQDNLSLSLYADDILNQNKRLFGAYSTEVLLSSDYDSRRFGVSLSYKFPNKKKTNTEVEDILLKTPNKENE